MPPRLMNSTVRFLLAHPHPTSTYSRVTMNSLVLEKLGFLNALAIASLVSRFIFVAP